MQSRRESKCVHKASSFLRLTRYPIEFGKYFNELYDRRSSYKCVNDLMLSRRVDNLFLIM